MDIAPAAMYKMVRNLSKFPYPRICRHAVSLDLLSFMEEKGEVPPLELVKAVGDCDDELAIELLNKLI